MKNDMENDYEFYERLAGLFEYPDSSWPVKLAACMNRNDSESFSTFRESVGNTSLPDLQELYTRTFDLNPVCALEIGYHLFGENYKRGEFLANLRETEAPFDLGQDAQLPDYLPVLLRLLTKLEDEELRTALIAECMIPAIDKMIKALHGNDNPYRHLLETVQEKLRSEAGGVENQLFTRARLERASLPVLESVVAR
jgi:nitrate reductase delta subunit